MLGRQFCKDNAGDLGRDGSPESTCLVVRVAGSPASYPHPGSIPGRSTALIVH